MAVDLHLHSIASDGTFTPTKVVETAHRLGLKCISLTDHDTIAGVQEAADTAERLGIQFIPGIELSSIEEGKEHHLLGYFIDINNKELVDYLTENLKRNRERIESMVKILYDMGYHIDFERVDALALGGNPGRPHIARALLEKQYIENVQEAFDKLIGTNCPAYLEPDSVSRKDCYSLINKAGGIASVAHPGLFGRAGMVDENEMLVHRELGALAIEAFHTKHDTYITSAYIKIAKQLDMGITGGSDCHGDYYSSLLMEKINIPDWVGEDFIKFKDKINKERMK